MEGERRVGVGEGGGEELRIERGEWEWERWGGYRSDVVFALTLPKVNLTHTLSLIELT